MLTKALNTDIHMLTSLLIHHPNPRIPSPPPQHPTPTLSLGRPAMTYFPLPPGIQPPLDTANPPPYKDAATEPPPPAYIPPSRSPFPTNLHRQRPLIQLHASPPPTQSPLRLNRSHGQMFRTEGVTSESKSKSKLQPKTISYQYLPEPRSQ